VTSAGVANLLFDGHGKFSGAQSHWASSLLTMVLIQRRQLGSRARESVRNCSTRSREICNGLGPREKEPRCRQKDTAGQASEQKAYNFHVPTGICSATKSPSIGGRGGATVSILINL